MTQKPLPHPLTDDDGNTITSYVAQADFLEPPFGREPAARTTFGPPVTLSSAQVAALRLTLRRLRQLPGLALGASNALLRLICKYS